MYLFNHTFQKHALTDNELEDILKILQLLRAEEVIHSYHSAKRKCYNLVIDCGDEGVRYLFGTYDKSHCIYDLTDNVDGQLNKLVNPKKQK